MASLRPFIYLATFAIALGLLYAAKVILVPIALAVLLAFVLNPLVTRLQRWGVGRTASVVLVALLAVLLCGGIGTGLTLQIKEMGEQLPQYHENIVRKIAALREAGKGNVLEKVQDTVNAVQQRLKEEDQAPRETAPEPIPVQVVPSDVSEFGKFAGPAVETFATAGLVIVLAVFMLIYREDLRSRMIRLIGHGRLLITTRAIDEASQRISRYLVMQLIINAGFGLALGIGLILIGVPYALLWGALVAVLRFIPYVGSWLAGALLLAIEDYLHDHPAEAVYDDILVPTLVLAKRDRARGGLTTDDEQFIHQVTRDILNDVLASPPPQPAGGESTPTEHDGPQAIVLGCPARDEADELALHMFRQLLRISQSRAEIEVLSAKSLAGEMVARIKDAPPALVCIAALPPGGLAQARYLCKRIHSAVPEQRILIGRWGGLPEHAEHTGERLLDACADRVAKTLIESRSQSLPLIQLAASQPESAAPAHAPLTRLGTLPHDQSAQPLRYS
jgi:predicted PurR-regulated permease PerM